MKRMVLLFVLLSTVPALANTIETVELITNGGFETGNLSPWLDVSESDGCQSFSCRPWQVDSGVAHSGSFFAVGANGNVEMRQSFQPTLGSRITDVSFWASSGELLLVNLFYSDNSVSISTPEIDCSATWCFVDLTFRVDPEKSLSGISFVTPLAGFSAVDDVSIMATIPEPGTFGLLGLGVAVLGTALIKRKSKCFLTLLGDRFSEWSLFWRDAPWSKSGSPWQAPSDLRISGI